MTVAHENKGGPAFPGEDQNNYYWGMSLRDWFATHATEADILEHRQSAWSDEMTFEYRFSREEARYRFADAMLAERAKP